MIFSIIFSSLRNLCIIIAANDPKEHIFRNREDVNSNLFSAKIRGYAVVSINGPFMRDPLLARGGNQCAVISEGSLTRMLFF